MYPKGGHGFGMNNPTTKDKWMDRLRNWLEKQRVAETLNRLLAMGQKEIFNNQQSIINAQVFGC